MARTIEGNGTGIHTSQHPVELFGRLVDYGRQLADHEGEDLAVEVMIKALKNPARIPANPLAYLCRMLRNAHTDMFRGSKGFERGFVALGSAPVIDRSPSPLEVLLDEEQPAEDVDPFHALSGRMDAAEFRVLELIYRDDCTCREIAEALGVKVWTVYRLRKRALKKARKILGKVA